MSELKVESNQPRGVVVIVEVMGNIGSGKTTLVGRLSEGLRDLGIPVVVSEELTDDLAGFLPLVYHHENRAASLLFQAAMTGTRGLKLLEATDRAAALGKSAGGKPVVVLVDQAMGAQAIFGRNLLSPVEAKCLGAYLSCAISYLPQPDVVIFLDTEVAVCATRIANRGREGEENVSLEYLERLGKDFCALAGEYTKKGQLLPVVSLPAGRERFGFLPTWDVDPVASLAERVKKILASRD